MIVNGGFDARTEVAHPLGGLDCLQHRLVSLDEIGEDMVVDEGITVTGVERGGGATYENGVRHDLLQLCCRGQNLVQRGTSGSSPAYHI